MTRIDGSAAFMAFAKTAVRRAAASTSKDSLSYEVSFPICQSFTPNGSRDPFRLRSRWEGSLQ